MKTQAITQIQAQIQPRIKTNLKEFDDFMGGGFVDGQTVFIAGQPGVGKSTLLLQLATLLSDIEHRVLYVSGEESLEQLKLRADRLNTLRESIYCSDGIILEDLYNTLHQIHPKFIIIDSLQMLTSTEVKGEPGSSKQMKHCLLSLIAHAKKTGRVLIIIGHSTKTGMVAGLLTLQHMVDTVIFISKDDAPSSPRYMTAKKNRFGNVDEVFKMNMEERGFKQFSQKLQTLKGSQVAPRKVYGDGKELRLSKKDIEGEINNGFIRSVFGGLIDMIEKKIFGEVLSQDYQLVFKLDNNNNSNNNSQNPTVDKSVNL